MTEKEDREKEKGRQNHGLRGGRAEQIGWGWGADEEEWESLITCAFSLENRAILHIAVFAGIPIETSGVIFYWGSDPSLTLHYVAPLI